MSDTHEPLLKEQMDELHQWFDRLYGKTRRAKLKIYTKYNIWKGREEYLIDMFYDSTSKTLPFAVPKHMLDDIEMRVKIKERWVSEMQKKIMEVLK